MAAAHAHRHSGPSGSGLTRPGLTGSGAGRWLVGLLAGLAVLVAAGMLLPLKHPRKPLYLVTVLNSGTLLRIIQPLQARGEHNPRDFDKYVWRAPIPLFDPTDELHKAIVEVGARARAVAENVELPNLTFQALRRRIRTALDDSGVSGDWEAAISELFAVRTGI